MPRPVIRQITGSIQFAAGELEPDLIARANVVDRANVSRIAQRDLERYYAHLRLALATITPAFTEAEVTVIVNALSGTFTEPHTAVLLWANVSDFLNDQREGDPWYFHAPVFVARLRKLPPFTALAICDAVERIFVLTRLGEVKTLDEAYRVVGLIHD